MDLTPLAIANGWAAGINAYAVVLVMGLLGRFAGVEQVPELLQRADVLAVAALLTVLDLVADKIAYLDSVWDSVHTVVRPVLAAAVGALLAGQAGAPTSSQVATALGAGATALVSHLTKAGIRLAVNTSPEPASNIAVSTVEDVSVVGVVALAFAYPWIAAGIALLLLVVGVTLVLLLASRVRRGLQSRRERRALRVRAGPRLPQRGPP